MLLNGSLFKKPFGKPLLCARAFVAFMIPSVMVPFKAEISCEVPGVQVTVIVLAGVEQVDGVVSSGLIGKDELMFAYILSVSLRSRRIESENMFKFDL